MNAKHFLQLAPLILLGFLLQPRAEAQLLVTTSLDRSNYVVHEPVMLTVTVQNMAGKDILLGGPSGASWLLLDVRAGDSHTVPPDAGLPQTKPIMLKNGQKITRQIDLMSFYPIEDPAAYIVSASVYFPELQRWIGSTQKQLFRTVSAKPAFWERTVGLPKTHRSYGRYRRYKLFTNKSNALTPSGSMEVQLLYLQVLDEETGGNLTTYPLSQILNYRDPQATTDAQGNLHVLFMWEPQRFYHLSVDVDGAILDKKIYLGTEAGIPTLMQGSDGHVTVRGGKYFDPILEAELARKKAKDLRNLSDRPPGFPQ